MMPEKGTSAKKVTLRDAKEDVDKVCIKVQKTSDNAGGNPTPGFSLQHKTFSALSYAKDFGTTVKESLKRTTNSKWAILTHMQYQKKKAPNRPHPSMTKTLFIFKNMNIFKNL